MFWVYILQNQRGSSISAKPTTYLRACIRTIAPTRHWANSRARTDLGNWFGVRNRSLAPLHCNVNARSKERNLPSGFESASSMVESRPIGFNQWVTGSIPRLLSSGQHEADRPPP